MLENNSGMIFDIQRFCVHDGPGIRTTVFFKGCNLRCFWCHNPESYNMRRELMLYPQKCIGCGKCFGVCPAGCHIPGYAGENKETERKLNRAKCISCGKCAENCNSGALVTTGKEYDADEIMKTVSADLPFYKNSGGGMTCSGGEPLLQPEFVSELLGSARKLGIHTAVDTAGNIDYTVFERVLPDTNLILFDIKCMNDEKHKKVTRVSNKNILENLKRLGKCGVPIWIRIPVIPGVNDNPDNMNSAAEFLKPLAGVERIELLPYHNLGAGKYESLGVTGNNKEILKIPAESEIKELASAFANNNCEVKP